MSRFSRIARRTRSVKTGSLKASHHATSGSISEAVAAANVAGRSSDGLATGVEHPVKARVIDTASAAAKALPARQSAYWQVVCPTWRVNERKG